MPFLAKLGALRRLDWSLFALTLLLTSFGLAALYSVTINVENPSYDQFLGQAGFALIGLIIMVLVALVDYRVWWNSAWPLYILGALLLIAVLFFGETIRGTRGWFVIFGRTFQPVEFVRIFLVLGLSRFFANRELGQGTMKTILWSGLMVALYVVLLALEPEFGYSAVLMGTWLILLFFQRIPKWQFALVILSFLALMVFSWFFVLEDYQKGRVLTFLSPGQDTLGDGYNVTQSVVAIGSGQLFGRGLGLGPQSQLNFLPEQSTDFIFAAIAEELGFVGALLVIGAFTILFFRILSIIRRSRDMYTTHLLTSLLLLLFLQCFINIGMNLGLLPVTGIPLPFVSSGGSALLANFFIIGILQSISMRQPGSAQV